MHIAILLALLGAGFALKDLLPFSAAQKGIKLQEGMLGLERDKMKTSNDAQKKMMEVLMGMRTAERESERATKREERLLVTGEKAADRESELLQQALQMMQMGETQRMALNTQGMGAIAGAMGNTPPRRPEPINPLSMINALRM